MVRALSSAMTGLSAQGHHASVLSVVDGGDSLINQKLNDLLDRIEGVPELQGVDL